MDSPLLQVESVRVQIHEKRNSPGYFHGNKRGEQWMIFGEAGSGKTVLAHTLAGNHAIQGPDRFQRL